MRQPELNPGDYHKLGLEDRAMSDLWRSVVTQAIRDMGSGIPAVQLEAVQWLNSQDFDECCLLAFIDGEELRDRLKEILQMKSPYRKLLLRDLADLLRDPPPKPCELAGELDHALASEPEFDPGD